MRQVSLARLQLITVETLQFKTTFNPFECRGNYSATSNNMKLGCYIWYSEEGPGRDPSPPMPLLAVPNVTPPINGQCTNHRIDV